MAAGEQKNRVTACFCNNISTETILKTIECGASSLSDLYDKTQAGVGPCGGSCRGFLKKLLSENTSTNSNPVDLKTANSIIVPPELDKAISLFNRRYYWETHEVLENIWLEASGVEKTFLQALIQAAAAFYHVLNANPQGALRLSQAAIEKFAGFSDTYLTIPLADLKSSLKDFSVQSKEIMGQTRSGYDYTALPRLTIGSEMDK